MVHLPATFRENTSMRFRVTVRKLNVTEGRTDGRGGGGALQYLPSQAFGLVPPCHTHPCLMSPKRTKAWYFPRFPPPKTKSERHISPKLMFHYYYVILSLGNSLHNNVIRNHFRNNSKQSGDFLLIRTLSFLKILCGLLNRLDY